MIDTITNVTSYPSGVRTERRMDGWYGVEEREGKISPYVIGPCISEKQAKFLIMRLTIYGKC